MRQTISPPTTAEPSTTTAPSHHRRIDLAIGIVLGIVLGLAVTSAFVFLGSEGSIDAPRISGVDTGKPSQHAVPGGAPEAAMHRPSQP